MYTDSMVKENIYDILDEYLVKDFETHDVKAVKAVEDYLMNYAFVKEYSLDISPWPDFTGGACAVAWTEVGGHLYTLMFDYIEGEMK